MWRHLLLSILLLANPGTADDATDLKKLQQEIRKLEQWLNNAKDEYSQLDKDLRQSDLDISRLNKEIENTRKALKEEQARLKKLQQEQSQLHQLRQQHRQHLADQLRAAHHLGSQGPLKLLLNQDDPQQAQRLMRYFRYFNDARIANIRHILSELTRLETLAEQISAQQQRLQKTENRLLKQNQTLQARQRQQNKLMATLARQMSNHSERLKRKQADRKRLQTLLSEVQTLLDNSPRRQDARPFRSMKGKLPRPVKGRILKAFGNANSDNRSHWEGWLMSTGRGNAVHAVHHGRVVFSDWLRGFGLLTILDHGKGYLSLYAYNQTLMYDVGAWVNRGDIISRSGVNSNNAMPSLYFEIRHNGRPLDPAAWLKRQ